VVELLARESERARYFLTTPRSIDGDARKKLNGIRRVAVTRRRVTVTRRRVAVTRRCVTVTRRCVTVTRRRVAITRRCVAVRVFWIE
jgi:hypothetical protein